MLPPFKVELWGPKGDAQLINMTMSFEAAERAVKEHVGGLGPNEVIRVRNARGELVLSSDSISH